jgi:hypothetical protein
MVMRVCCMVAQWVAFRADRIHLAAGDDEVAAGLQHLALGDEIVAVGRRQQVELEFDGEHVRAGGHQRVAGVAAGAVDDGAGDAGVEVAVLLRQVVAEGQADLAVAGRQRAQPGADQGHHLLPGKAPPHRGLPIRVARNEGVLCGASRVRHASSGGRRLVDVDVNVNIPQL